MNISNFSQLAFILLTSGSSTLDSPIRKALQHHADLYFVLLLVSTAFVAIGIFFEWPEVRDGFSEWWGLRPSQTSWLVSPPRRSRLPVWTLIGFIFVSGGVAAEGVFEGLVGIEDTKIKNFDKGAIDDAELKTAELQQSTQQLKTDAEKARRQAESERLERVKLQETVQARAISESDRQCIADKLRGTLKPAGQSVKIYSQVGDSEGTMFALEIMDALQRAGITVDGSGIASMVSVHTVAVGVIITGPPSDEKFMRSLVNELGSRSTPARPSVAGYWKPEFTELRIMVGVKPIPGIPKGLVRPPK